MENSHLEVKLLLRRHFLGRYHHTGDRRVFDGFQARGLLWSILRKEFPLTTYWGVDVQEKKGRIKIDSARVLAQPGWRENIIDLDAYGSPWKHWLGMLSAAERSLTVFLTVGSRKGIQRRPLMKMEKALLEIPFKLPRAIGANLVPLTLNWMLAQACERFDVAEACEAVPSTTARYFGIRLELKKSKVLSPESKAQKAGARQNRKAIDVSRPS